jgi:Arc/MetJ-type ribon-helix-helix transcriptional regulator|tara:strand:+ start:1355 stop:2104 length:750 start_codon:yes stop_codon:yes gene_type:complete
MAEPTTISQVLPAPVLEGALTAFTKKIEPLMGQTIDTGAYAPTIAAQDALQTQAAQAAAGLGSLTGAQAYEPFMSPYQQEVIDTTLTEYDRNAAVQRQGLRDSAIQSGAYGGGREGVQRAEYQQRSDMGRAGLQAQLLAQNFQQAQAQANQQLAAQQGLGQYQTAIGQGQQAFTQAGLDAAAAAAREATYEPFTRLGLVGQQLAQIQPGAFPTQTVGYQAPGAPPSPLASALGIGGGIASIGNKLGLFG